MNQNKVTITFLAAALVALLLGWEPWRRSIDQPTVETEVGNGLLPKFTDSKAAANLAVVKFDEDAAALSQFTITRTGKGVWSIPSHSDYPADAREHLAQAATALREVKILGVASSRKGDQELYGVATPDNKLSVGSKGVGTRVTIQDAQGVTLADVIVGKEVKDQTDQRYVRRQGNDTIFRVKLSPDKFSTKFSDWIEKDLLKLNAFDIREVGLNDYSVDIGLNGAALHKRSEMKVAYDDQKSSWTMVDCTTYRGNKPETVKLGEDEELNSEKLNNLRSALDDLEIVDVHRKPKGLAVNLDADQELLKEDGVIEYLQDRGFFLGPGKGGKLAIYSKEGEVICTMKDGVEYVLRFGNSLAGGGDDAKPKDEKPTKGAAAAKSAKPSRLVFVTARFNPDPIAKPMLEPMPGDLKKEELKEEGKKEEGKKAEGKKEDKPLGDGKKEGKDKPTAKSPAEAGSKPVDEKKDAGADKSADDQPPSSEQVGKAAAAAADEPKAADKPATKPTADTKPKSADDKTKPADDKAKPADDKAKPADDKPKGADAKRPEDKAAEDARRTLVEQENKRKQEEYDRKLKDGEKHVQELNERFADWYYIISDEVYQKIHLGRADVVKKKEKPAPGKGNGVSDLNELEKGLKKE